MHGVATRRERRQANADRQVWVSAARGVLDGEALDRRTDAIHRRFRVGSGLFPEHDQKLFASVAVDVIGAPEAALDATRDAPKSLVAGEVSVVVVVELESVEIAHRDDCAAAVARDLGLQGREVLLEPQSIRDLRQRIDTGRLEESLAVVAQDDVAPGELPVGAHHAGRGDEPGLEIIEVDGLCQVIVGPGAHRIDEVALAGMAAGEQQIRVVAGVQGAHLPTPVPSHPFPAWPSRSR